MIMKKLQFINQIKFNLIIFIKNIVLVSWIYSLLYLGIQIGSGKIILIMENLMNSTFIGSDAKMSHRLNLVQARA